MMANISYLFKKMAENGAESSLHRSSPRLEQYVKLNVGGSLFQTTISTLTKYDSMLKAMFSGRMEVLRDAEGYVLIDRCGKNFGLILNFLREGAVPLPECRAEVQEILIEAKYYLIQELVDLCISWLVTLERDQMISVSGVTRVPIVVSKKQVEQIVQKCSGRPVIELLLNRQNNKYSYNSTVADENFLRNQELFDKLILRFNNRVLFIKNIGIGSSEICQWTFYGYGNKKVEICCTSIVYATDKKQTKVEFPEARIYEEALNALLTFDQDFSGVCVRCKTATAATANSGEALSKWEAGSARPNSMSRLLAPEHASITGNGRIDWRLEQLALCTLSGEDGAGHKRGEGLSEQPSSSSSLRQQPRATPQQKVSECETD